MRNPKEIEKDQYSEFYKKTFNEFLDPLAHTHFTTEVLVLHFSYIFWINLLNLNLYIYLMYSFL